MATFLRFHLIVLVMMNFKPANGAAITYDHQNEGLTTFPEDIPSDVNDIVLTSNYISVIENFPTLPNLDKLCIPGNNLEEFPDLTPVAGTLTTLIIENNFIMEIPTALMLPLQALTTLSVYGNPLLSLPNFGMMPASPPLSVMLLGSEPLHCDWQMAAVKEAQDAGKISFDFYDPICVTPAALSSINWVNIGVSDMTFEDVTPYRETSFVSYDVSSIAVYPSISTILADTGFMECGRECISTVGCTMFALDSGSCVITTLNSGPAAAITAYADWFIRQ